MIDYKHDLNVAIEMYIDQQNNPEKWTALRHEVARELFPSIQEQMYDAMIAYRAAGLSVFPVDIEKRPLIPWKNGPRNLQIEQPTVEDIEEWTERAYIFGIAIVCGFNGTIGLDFDDPAYYRKWLADVSTTERIDDLAIEQSPRDGGGVHVGYRLNDDVKIPHTTTLAKRDDGKNAIELKANSTQVVGGAVIIATPSLHKSGRQYRMIQGDWTKLPTVDQKRHDRFIEAARSLDARRSPEAAPDILLDLPAKGVEDNNLHQKTVATILVAEAAPNILPDSPSRGVADNSPVAAQTPAAAQTARSAAQTPLAQATVAEMGNQLQWGRVRMNAEIVGIFVLR